MTWKQLNRKEFLRPLWVHKAKAHECPICSAKPGQNCWSTVRGRMLSWENYQSHLARMDLAMVVTKTDKVECWICGKACQYFAGMKISGCEHENRPDLMPDDDY